ncbi:MAG: TetR family transcriptional regulator [Thermoflavifilum sp.]|nr:TetR family transcriptional regulator [Thermoflavifilum sp.]
MKKEKILEVAEELFAEKGYEGTSVRDIAQRAEVNIAMISYYFGSKEKLLEALIQYRAGYTSNLLDILKKNPNEDPIHKMEKVIDVYVDRILTHHRFHNIMSRQLSMLSEAHIKEQMMAIKKQNLDIIKKIIEEGQKKKIFRKVDIELTVASIVGTISQVTLSKSFYCRLMNIPEINFDEYSLRIKNRVKKHLKKMILTHLIADMNQSSKSTS